MAAKELRKNLVPLETMPLSDAETDLKVVQPALRLEKVKQLPDKTVLLTENVSPPTILATNLKPIWVRHTVGLRDTTSLNLRDAADGQKRKERRGQLELGEPANEQEIADLGINLALKQLGFLSSE
ncbi:hypothetical protein Pla144_45820 [Bythopirellula polymerisocia]|uniref:Uncharacterized protein n=2 Tax=Bythopirellula polymerisocia TaxID=2528003 RepID=A0A5C6CB98_9BACT|nr:hypothetical protein Pla144_45820 [Bythopirellula polymerisocia]